MKTERLPGGPRKFIAPVNNNIETCEHFCSTANPEGEGTHILWLCKILQFEGGYDKGMYMERHSGD